MAKLLCMLPVGNDSAEIVTITVMDQNFKTLATILQEKFKNEDFFKFVPSLEEQMKKQGII